jgi:DMSO/TMAO reductase YedYZ molybdopterin-dependent catalytic subunit
MTRWTNLALAALLAGAFLSGWLGFGFGTAPARWSLVGHALTGLGLLVLVPWKSIVVRHGIERRRPGRWVSVGFGGLIALSLLAGLLHSTGALLQVGGVTAMEVHVGAAFAAVPLAIWHLLARPVRPRPVDLSRRSLLRAGGVLAGSAVLYEVAGGFTRLLALPGGARRFTGSYETASFQPAQLPVTQWMFDSVPQIRVDAWHLSVRTSEGSRRWGYEELAAFDDQLEATLDCTGGFYSRQQWSGVWLSRLVSGVGGARSIHVRSRTGYDRRFPIQDLPRILLATRVGDQPLAPGNGFPLRIVAADRRAFWWVKWVDAIGLDDLPPWWQSPFPLQ